MDKDKHLQEIDELNNGCLVVLGILALVLIAIAVFDILEIV